MAYRNHQVMAFSAAALIAAALLAGLLPVALEAMPRADVFDAYLLGVLRFTLQQAGLSTFLSLTLAVPLALILARHTFPGRSFVIRLFAIPLGIPAIVAILGIVEVFGATGLLGGWFDLYGLTGILIAHVFFNMPMAARVILDRLHSVPPETLRLSQSLAFSGMDRFRHIEWPVIRSGVPGLAGLIFLLCAASFAVVLTLGGGPAATTLEVAIYQSLRFDYDPPRAAAFAIAQLALCAILLAIAARLGMRFEAWPELRQGQSRRAPLKLAPAAFLIALTLFIAMPVAAVIANGIMAPWATAAWLPALFTSAAIAAASAVLAVAGAWCLAPSPRYAAIGYATLMLPPAVLATGWFILAVRGGAQSGAGVPLVILLNALMALPFALSVLAPAIARSRASNDQLCAALGLAGVTRFRLIDLPGLSRPLGLAFAMSLVVSLGDLTAITLFGSEDLVTLPSLIHSQMGSYRLGEATGSALILLALAAALMALADRWSAR